MERGLYQLIRPITSETRTKEERQALLELRFSYMEQRHPILAQIRNGMLSLSDHFDDVYTCAERGDDGPLRNFCDLVGAPFDAARRAATRRAMTVDTLKNAVTVGLCSGGLLGLEEMLERQDVLRSALVFGLTATAVTTTYLFFRVGGWAVDFVRTYVPVVHVDNALQELRD